MPQLRRIHGHVSYGVSFFDDTAERTVGIYFFQKQKSIGVISSLR